MAGRPAAVAGVHLRQITRIANLIVTVAILIYARGKLSSWVIAAMGW
jgi:hypothetical protein